MEALRAGRSPWFALAPMLMAVERPAPLSPWPVVLAWALLMGLVLGGLTIALLRGLRGSRPGFRGPASRPTG